MKARTDNDLTLPPAFAADVQETANQEHRPALDVLRDAFERYKEEQEWTRIFAYGEEQAKAPGLTEDDIPRLIAESRQEARQEHR